MNVGIKESLELIGFIMILAEALEEAKKDGNVNWLDIPKFAPTIIAAREAIQGSKKIRLEIEDLSPEESKTLALSALIAGQTLIGALLKK